MISIKSILNKAKRAMMPDEPKKTKTVPASPPLSPLKAAENRLVEAYREAYHRGYTGLPGSRGAREADPRVIAAEADYNEIAGKRTAS